MSDQCVYAGTFDPVTFGHIDIARRAAKIFSTVHIAVAEAGSSSKQPLLSAQERLELFRTGLKGEGEDRFRFGIFSGLLVDYLKTLNARVIIRGLRAVSDYEYEAQIAMTNRQLMPELETVFLLTSERYSFITSSIVREVARFGGDLSALVPPHVATHLKQKK